MKAKIIKIIGIFLLLIGVLIMSWYLFHQKISKLPLFSVGGENKTASYAIPSSNLNPGQTVNYKLYIEDSSGNWNVSEAKSFVVENVEVSTTEMIVTTQEETIQEQTTTSSAITTRKKTTTTINQTQSKPGKNYLLYAVILVPVIGIAIYLMLKGLGGPSKKLDKLVKRIPPTRMQEFQSEIYLTRNMLSQGMKKSAESHIRNIEDRLKRIK